MSIGARLVLTLFLAPIGRLAEEAKLLPSDGATTDVTGVVPGSGDVKRYQFWYRDPAGPCGSNFNLSNGYEITW